MEAFDLNVVKQKALNEGSTSEEQRDIYRTELFDWTDNYTENLESTADSDNAIKARQAIVQLWDTLAQMEINAEDGGPANAMEVYAEAACDAIAGAEINIYNLYATALLENEEMSKAARNDQEKVSQYPFLNGLIDGKFTAENTETLWKLYLETYNSLFTTGAADAIDMSGLYIIARAIMAGDTDSFDELVLTLPPSLQGKEEMGEDQNDVSESDSAAGATLYLEEQDEEKVQEILLRDLDTCEGLTPELVVKKYHVSPPLLFEPMASDESIKMLPPLRPEDRHALEQYLGISVSHSDMSKTCQWILDIIETLWLTQALKERDYASWFIELEEQHNEECIRSKERAMKATAAGGTMSDLAAHQKKLDSKLAVQRELLTAVVNKSLLYLLEEQLSVLNQIGFPGVSSSLWERIESHVVNHKLGTVLTQVDVNLKEQMTRLQQMISILLQNTGRLTAHVAQVKAKKSTRFSTNLEMPGVQSSLQPAPVLSSHAPQLQVPQQVTQPETVLVENPPARASKRKVTEITDLEPVTKKAPKKAAKAAVKRDSQVKQLEIDDDTAKAMAAAAKSATRRTTRSRR
jgi:hypothetical protein